MIKRFVLKRHFGIPLARYMDGSVVKRQRYGFTFNHALKRCATGM